MKEKQFQRVMSQLMRGGLIISLLLTAIGGALYLFSLAPISSSLILTGIFILVLSQVLRIALLVYYFFKQHDLKFVAFSLFILAVLIYSIFWRVLMSDGL